MQALFALLAFLHRYTGESGTLPWQLSPTFTPVLIRLSQWQSACQSSHLSADTPQALARKLVTLMIAAAPEIARRDRGPARPAPPSAAAQSGPVEHPRDAPKQPSVGPPTSAAHLDDQKPMLRPLNVYRKAPTNLLHSNGHDFPDKPALSPFLQPAEAAHHSQPINIGHAETSSPGYLAAYRGATHASHSSPPVSPRTPTRQSSLASDGEGDPLLVGLVDELCTLSVHAVLMGEDDAHILRQASILAGPEGSAADSGASQMQHDAQDELAGASSLQGSSSPRISGLQVWPDRLGVVHPVHISTFAALVGLIGLSLSAGPSHSLLDIACLFTSGAVGSVQLSCQKCTCSTQLWTAACFLHACRLQLESSLVQVSHLSQVLPDKPTLSAVVLPTARLYFAFNMDLVRLVHLSRPLRMSMMQGNIYACQPQGSQGVQTAMPGLSPLRDSEFEDVPLEPRCHVQVRTSQHSLMLAQGSFMQMCTLGQHYNKKSRLHESCVVLKYR